MGEGTDLSKRPRGQTLGTCVPSLEPERVLCHTLAVLEARHGSVGLHISSLNLQSDLCCPRMAWVAAPGHLGLQKLGYQC